ncbi:hypothetical protein B0H17DRAFT_1133145 [Mycena rosella]|uniref:Uncharacterized protein n=1 Tax=Mycena rosella TaxID=1033263 RepID=A0AAD7DIC6_MYCRO|nr:hypothetical protein B0H17DRAFT_1133145 [Mycena rosella]
MVRMVHWLFQDYTLSCEGLLSLFFQAKKSVPTAVYRQARITTVVVYGRLRGTVHPWPYHKILLRGSDGTVTGAVYMASMRPFYGNGVQPYAFETNATLSHIKRGSEPSISQCAALPDRVRSVIHPASPSTSGRGPGVTATASDAGNLAR